MSTPLVDGRHHTTLDVFEVGATITFSVVGPLPPHRQRCLVRASAEGAWAYDGWRWVRRNAAGEELANVLCPQGRVWRRGKEGYRPLWSIRFPSPRVARDPHKTDFFPSRRAAMQAVEDHVRPVLTTLTYFVIG